MFPSFDADHLSHLLQQISEPELCSLRKEFLTSLQEAQAQSENLRLTTRVTPELLHRRIGSPNPL